jgi:hypothetical protein
VRDFARHGLQAYCKRPAEDDQSRIAALGSRRLYRHSLGRGRAMTSKQSPPPRAGDGGATSKEQHESYTPKRAESKGRSTAPQGLTNLIRRGGRSDFDAINMAVLVAFPAVLARILPGGKRVGADIVAFNPRRADRHLGSFKINRCGKHAICVCAYRTAQQVALDALMSEERVRRGCQATPRARSSSSPRSGSFAAKLVAAERLGARLCHRGAP